MVLFLTTPVGSGHVHGFVKRFDRSWGRDLVEMTYSDLFRRGEAPTGCAYLFADRERMSDPFRKVAAGLWNTLEQSGEPVRLLNDPRTQLSRYELLEALHKGGVNDFCAFRVDRLALETPRFPVFLRIEDDHGGPRSELLFNWDELEQGVRRLQLAGVATDRILAVEFVDTADRDGVRRKYGAVRIGDTIICQHILFSREWNVKAEGSLRDAEFLDESDAYFESNPHAEMLMPLFDVAKIEFGRIDYSFRDGKIQVWEINDNPVIATGRFRRISRLQKGPAFHRAFLRLTDGLPVGTPVPITLDAAYGRLGLRSMETEPVH